MTDRAIFDFFLYLLEKSQIGKKQREGQMYNRKAFYCKAGALF